MCESDAFGNGGQEASCPVLGTADWYRDSHTSRLSRGGTDVWRAWIGFNLSHSLGVLLLGAVGISTGCRIRILPVNVIMPVFDTDRLRL